MPAFDACEATIDSVRSAILNRQVSVRGVAEAFLARVEALNPAVNAVIALNSDALRDADRLDAELASKLPCGLLFGVPIMLKDNFDAVPMPTTGGCLALREFRPRQDAPIVAALRRAGAIILGKTNMHELALEGLTVSSLGGQTVNPYDSTRTPGGSSGGSAAAVAASFCVFATGSDTMNSLRSPPSANSLYGMRPSWGLLTRSGVVPVSYTQDTVGPIARNVRDLAMALTVMASSGYDSADDATSIVPDEAVGLNYVAGLESGTLQGMRLGLVQSFSNFAPRVETTPVNNNMAALVQRLERAGAEILCVRDKIFNSSAILAELDVQQYEFRERLTAYMQSAHAGGAHPLDMTDLYESGEFLVIPSQYDFVKASLASSTEDAAYDGKLRRIHELKRSVLGIFKSERLDALIYPEQTNLVVKIGSPSQNGRNGFLAAVTGLPVVVVPIGFSPPDETAPRGVPVGMEILGKPWQEKKLLQIAYQIERLEKIRQTPKLADRSIEPRTMSTVPMAWPDSSSIPSAYPVGRITEEVHNSLQRKLEPD